MSPFFPKKYYLTRHEGNKREALVMEVVTIQIQEKKSFLPELLPRRTISHVRLCWP